MEAQGKRQSHRDLKLNNIMVEGFCGERPDRKEKDPYVKIIDFGCATFCDSQDFTKDGNIRLGSKPYMAPELINHQPHDEKVDIWALGVIAFVLLTDETFPFGCFSGVSDSTDGVVRESNLSDEITSKQLDMSLLEESKVSLSGQDFIDLVQADGSRSL